MLMYTFHFCRSRSQEGKSRGNRTNKSSKPFSNLMGGSRNVEGDRDDNSENGKSSWFGGGGPFLGSNAKKDGKVKSKNNKKDKSGNVEDESNRGHWLLKEKKLDETSLPPNVAGSSHALNSGKSRFHIFCYS